MTLAAPKSVNEVSIWLSDKPLLVICQIKLTWLIQESSWNDEDEQFTEFKNHPAKIKKTRIDEFISACKSNKGKFGTTNSAAELSWSSLTEFYRYHHSTQEGKLHCH